jgi:hypothetical protein
VSEVYFVCVVNATCDVRELASGLSQEFPVRWLLAIIEIAQKMTRGHTYWIFESLEAIVWWCAVLLYIAAIYGIELSDGRLRVLLRSRELKSRTKCKLGSFR